MNAKVDIKNKIHIKPLFFVPDDILSCFAANLSVAGEKKYLYKLYF
ncbi:MAG: hypothetical protein QM594_02395 [Niabella sp.]